MGFPGGASGKEPVCQCRRLRSAGRSLAWEDAREGGYSSPLQSACLQNPWTVEPGGLRSMGSQGVGQTEVTKYTEKQNIFSARHEFPC